MPTSAPRWSSNPEAGGPGIITERDLLRASGSDEDLDVEHVRDHLTQRLTYASADWSLERAAGEMIRARFRHVVVVDGSVVVGILSMRDIVRCWTQDGAACGMSQARSKRPKIRLVLPQRSENVALATKLVSIATKTRRNLA